MPDRNEFLLQGPDDFVRLDQRCAELLRTFCDWMHTAEGGAVAAEQAGPLAHAADRYLRDFVVDIRETGPAAADPASVRQYLGNWYIIHTLTPTHEEIDCIREALTRLFAFLAREGIASEATARAAKQELARARFFHDRLDGFWSLTGEGIPAWRAVDDYRKRHGST